MNVKPSACALGLFDGVHLGHQAVLREAVDCEEEGLIPTVFTFQADSISFKQGKQFKYIYTEQQKEKHFSGMGIQRIYSPLFSELTSMDGETFCREILCNILNAKKVFCGMDFRFGINAEWGFDDLKYFGETMGFSVCSVEPVRMDKNIISSSAIRNALLNGDVKYAARMLGEPYEIYGTVEHGKALGRTINFPTINQFFHNGQLIPKLGVYASFVYTPYGMYKGITNIGKKPTVCDDIKPLAETHIIDFSGDLYEKVCKVQLLQFIRPEKKFSNIDELKKAIELDINSIVK